MLASESEDISSRLAAKTSLEKRFMRPSGFVTNTDNTPVRERTIERSSVGLKLNSASEVTAPERLRKSCVVRLAAPATRSSKPICCTNRSEGYNKWLQIASKTIAE